MKVVIDRFAWLPKDELTLTQLQAIRDALLVVPRKVGDHPGEEPEPIKLWVETVQHIGVPREFFLARRKPHHEIEYRYSMGEWLPSDAVPFVGELYGEQQEALGVFLHEFEDPSRTGGILRASPGWGKTVFACALMSKLRVPTLVVVHKEFLMDQWRERIGKFLPDARVGLVQQDECDFRDKHVALAMVHSLASKSYSPDLYNWPGLVITDECFPGDTLIATPEGPKAIQEFAEGDVVLCAAGEARVIRTLRRSVAVSSLREITLSDGSSFFCTRNHPFLTPAGWKPAEDLAGELVLTAAGCFGTTLGRGLDAPNPALVRDMQEAELCSERQAVLLSQVYGSGEATEGAASSVRVVWGGKDQEASRAFLRGLLSAELVEAGATEASVSHGRAGTGVACEESLGRARGFSAHAEEQSDAFSRGEAKGAGELTCDRSSTVGTGREREADTGAATVMCEVAGGDVEDGVRGRDGRPEEKSSGAAVSLQAGSRAGQEAGGGDRRSLTPVFCGQEGRREEGSVPAFLRVVRVEIPERARVDRPEGCSEGDQGCVEVYNLTVDRHPSYILSASKLVAHNCHRIGAETWAPVPAKFSARWRVGISATPRRKDGADDVFFYHIGSVLFSAKEQRLKPKIKRVWSNFRLVKTDRFNPSLAPRTLVINFLVASRSRNERIVDQMVRAAQAGRKLLVLSERLQHLDTLAQMFETRWQEELPDPVPTFGFYVGGKTAEEREDAAEAQIIMATSQYAQEGLDIPALDTLILATPMSDVEQAVGRILRSHPSKKEPIVVDIRDDNVPIFRKAGENRDRLYARIS